MNVIGIDFSMTSTAICVEIDGKDHFYSFVSGVPDKRVQCICENGIEVVKLDKLPTEKDSSSLEIEKVRRANAISDSITKTLKDMNVEFDILALENFSYGGTGRGILDLAGFQYVLRANLFNNGIAKQYMFHTPASVKKFAIKGNAKKNEIIQSYIDQSPDNNLTKLIKNQDCGLLSKQGNWQKPIDDLVDSYFIKEFSKV